MPSNTLASLSKALHPESSFFSSSFAGSSSM
ncbi:hypothetical protein A2U01_0050982, partial [Trifolium medium]|nr:hypothetical protein [Trifolium medium]